MKKAASPRLMLSLSMFIFGTIGIVRRYIPLSSAVIACCRGLIGSACLLIFVFIKGGDKKDSEERAALKKNLPLLMLSGMIIGLNWILLFEAYNYTTVATATLCYYMAPVFVILVSPAVLNESLSAKKLLCAGAAVLGMVLVSGILGGQPDSAGPSDGGKGIAFGLGAAALYACAMIINKKITGTSAYGKTIVQLFFAAVVTLPYIALTEGFGPAVSGFFSGGSPAFIASMILTAGIIHTGLAYALYFSSMEKIPVQSVAVMSYIDPVVALILSALLLKEPMGISGVIGAVLILGASFLSGRE